MIPISKVSLTCGTGAYYSCWQQQALPQTNFQEIFQLQMAGTSEDIYSLHKAFLYFIYLLSPQNTVMILFIWHEIFFTSIHMIFRLMKTWKQLTIKMQSSMTNSTSGKKSSQVCTYNMAEINTRATDCVFVLYGWGRLIAGYSLSTDCTPEEFTKCMPECCSESKCQTKTEDQCQLMSIDEIINGSVCRTIWFRYKVFKRMS